MADVDRIIEQLLGDRRIRESATFSQRTFADQPLIERGRDLQERMKRREAERAERHQQAAQQRQNERQRHAERQQRFVQQRQTRQQQRSTEPPAPAPYAEATRPQAARSTSRAQEPRQTSAFSSFKSLFDDAARSLSEVTLPQPIREMRQLEHGGVPASLTYGSTASASLFYRQACLMEHYEDDYEFNGTFSQYYPTYAAMSNQQLRGYFSWRTRVRAGEVTAAPLSFAFVYVYELLCGVGTTPGEEGLAALRSFGEAYCQASPFEGNRLMGYLRRWMRDYAIYHGVVSAFEADNQPSVATSVLTLMAAEHAQLREAGLSPRIVNTALSEETPSPDQVFHALGEAASYHIGQSRLAKDESVLLTQVATDVFAALVSHCAKRRKTDFVEGLFGYATKTPYTMFSAAVFFDPVTHPNCELRVSPVETFICANGRWTQKFVCAAQDRNSDLGLVMHEVDFELRRQLNYAYPLKQRKVPKYVERMVQKAVEARLKERADAELARQKAQEEAERRRITIDRTKLGSIRAAAALTQEALLTDEERDLAPAPEIVAPAAVAHAEPVAPEMPAPEAKAEAPVPASEPAPSPAGPAPAPAVADEPQEAAPEEAATCEAALTYGLTPLELRVLTGLLEGAPLATLLGPQDPFASVVVDTINEKLFDLVGDAIVEFDGDEPHIIEEYLEDVREVL